MPSLGQVIFFCLLEGVEAMHSGFSYLNDMWNVMDWVNFLIYFMVYAQLSYTQDAIATSYGPSLDCSHYLCSAVGYFDDWKVMTSFRKMKMYLSLCLCIQVLRARPSSRALVALAAVWPWLAALLWRLRLPPRDTGA